MMVRSWRDGSTIPALTEKVLNQNEAIRDVAKEFPQEHAFFIGRGYLYPVALEGALKLERLAMYMPKDITAELKKGRLHCWRRARRCGTFE